MEENKEQEIVQEYFKKQEESKLKLCIYEEKGINTNDIEWYYDDDTKEWCFLKIKKERYNGEWKEAVFIGRKRFKTFNDKCHVETMTFQNFMALDFLKLAKADMVYLFLIKAYADKFLALKKEGTIANINDYHKHLELEKEKKKRNKRIFNFVFWWLTISCIISPFIEVESQQSNIPIIFAILFCLWTWHLIKDKDFRLKVKNILKRPFARNIETEEWTGS